MNELEFGSWVVAESPLSIAYSLEAIEEIRQEVAQGFQNFSRGGVETGGILYGTREGRSINILAMSPIQCEHARGPDFLLSDRDRDMLERQIKQGFKDSRLEDLMCVGWFLSHTRSGIVLAESEQEIYSTYFGGPWQVTLVICPDEADGMRAGFFVREHDGVVRSDSSYLEFRLSDPLTAVQPKEVEAEEFENNEVEARAVESNEAEASELETLGPPQPPPPPAEPRVAASFGGDGGTAVVTARSEVPEPLLAETWEEPRLLPGPPRAIRWLWLVGWAAMVAGLTFALLEYYGVLTPRPVPLALSVDERDGQMHIEWNHNATPVTQASQGLLAIVDGADVHTVALTPRDLARGSFFYYRNSGDVQVRLAVTTPAGQKLGEEASRFLGHPPVSIDPNELLDLERQREESQAQVEQLKRDNQALVARIHELERTLLILQARLGDQ